MDLLKLLVHLLTAISGLIFVWMYIGAGEVADLLLFGVVCGKELAGMLWDCIDGWRKQHLAAFPRRYFNESNHYGVYITPSSAETMAQILSGYLSGYLKAVVGYFTPSYDTIRWSACLFLLVVALFCSWTVAMSAEWRPPALPDIAQSTKSIWEQEQEKTAVFLFELAKESGFKTFDTGNPTVDARARELLRAHEIEEAEKAKGSAEPQLEQKTRGDSMPGQWSGENEVPGAAKGNDDAPSGNDSTLSQQKAGESQEPRPETHTGTEDAGSKVSRTGVIEEGNATKESNKALHTDLPACNGVSARVQPPEEPFVSRRERRENVRRERMARVMANLTRHTNTAEAKESAKAPEPNTANTTSAEQGESSTGQEVAAPTTTVSPKTETKSAKPRQLWPSFADTALRFFCAGVCKNPFTAGEMRFKNAMRRESLEEKHHKAERGLMSRQSDHQTHHGDVAVESERFHQDCHSFSDPTLAFEFGKRKLREYLIKTFGSKIDELCEAIKSRLHIDEKENGLLQQQGGESFITIERGIFELFKDPVFADTLMDKTDLMDVDEQYQANHATVFEDVLGDLRTVEPVMEPLDANGDSPMTDGWCSSVEMTELQDNWMTDAPPLSPEVVMADSSSLPPPPHSPTIEMREHVPVQPTFFPKPQDAEMADLPLEPSQPPKMTRSSNTQQPSYHSGVRRRVLESPSPGFTIMAPSAPVKNTQQAPASESVQKNTHTLPQPVKEAVRPKPQQAHANIRPRNFVTGPQALEMAPQPVKEAVTPATQQVQASNPPRHHVTGAQSLKMVPQSAPVNDTPIMPAPTGLGISVQAAGTKKQQPSTQQLPKEQVAATPTEIEAAEVPIPSSPKRSHREMEGAPEAGKAAEREIKAARTPRRQSPSRLRTIKEEVDTKAMQSLPTMLGSQSSGSKAKEKSLNEGLQGYLDEKNNEMVVEQDVPAKKLPPPPSSGKTRPAANAFAPRKR